MNSGLVISGFGGVGCDVIGVVFRFLMLKRSFSWVLRGNLVDLLGLPGCLGHTFEVRAGIAWIFPAPLPPGSLVHVVCIGERGKLSSDRKTGNGEMARFWLGLSFL